MNKYKRSGWFNESHRHSLARQGIKTGRSSYAKKNTINEDIEKVSREARRIRLKKAIGLQPVVISYSKIDYSMMSKLQAFLHKKFNKAVEKQPKHVQEHPIVVKARHDIEKVTTWDKFKAWAKKYNTTITLLGLGALAGVLAVEAGVPTLMMNMSTGEIVSVGGTLIGRTGMITSTVFTGLGAGEGMMTIVDGKTLKDVIKKPEELKVGQKILVYKLKKKPQVNYSSSDYGNLSEISSEPIPFSKLTKQEQKTLKSSVRKVKLLLGKRGKKIDFNEKNLKIVKRCGPDDTAFGAHQGDLIQIDRDILKDEDKTEGVLLHEAIHKVYGVRDETRAIENLHIDYLGELM